MLTKWLTKKLEQIIDKHVAKRIAAEKEALAAEASIVLSGVRESVAGIDQTLGDLEATAVKAAENAFVNNLGPAITELRGITNENLQTLSKALAFAEEVFTDLQALIKILEPHIASDLRLKVAEAGFALQVTRAYRNLHDLPGDAHPAVMSLYQANLGKLYKQAQDNGWIHLYEKGVNAHGFNVTDDFWNREEMT